MPVKTLLDGCILFKQSVIYNYSFVDGKFLRKKPSTVIATKRTSDYLKNCTYSQDTFSRMLVDDLKPMLKMRGMKLGAVCTTSYTDKWGTTKELRDEFWFKDASIVRLTFNINEATQLSYYAGDLYLLTTKSTGFERCDLRASSGTGNYEGYGRVWHYSKDIRENLFRFYDIFKDDLIPQFSYRQGEDCYKLKYTTMDTYLLVNLVTQYQEGFSTDYINDDTQSDITYFSLFRLLAFKDNLKYFSEDFKQVLKPCISTLDSMLKYECKLLQKAHNMSKRDVQKAINWCVNAINMSNVTWKKC